MDKSKELKTSIKLLNEKLHFEVRVDRNEQPLSIYYSSTLGENPGYTSLELFLLTGKRHKYNS